MGELKSHLFIWSLNSCALLDSSGIVWAISSGSTLHETNVSVHSNLTSVSASAAPRASTGGRVSDNEEIIFEEGSELLCSVR